MLPLEALSVGTEWGAVDACQLSAQEKTEIQLYLVHATNVMAGPPRDQLVRIQAEVAENCLSFPPGQEGAAFPEDYASADVAATLLRLTIWRGLFGNLRPEVSVTCAIWFSRSADEGAVPDLWLSTIHALEEIYDFADHGHDELERSLLARQALGDLWEDDRLFGASCDSGA